jgi:Uma2 family endonuclease
MSYRIPNPELENELIERRRRTGADRFDEVWDGVYVMAPLADNEHQGLATGISAALHAAVEGARPGTVYAGVNVSDRADDWMQNYRCPDVAVFGKRGRATNCQTHWLGGPDFVVEITSPRDRSREKLSFYARVGTRELLLVDRDPWSLDLYRLEASELCLVGRSTLAVPRKLTSQVISLDWRLSSGETRPLIHISRTDGQQEWII